MTPRVTFDTGASPATLTRARSRSVDEVQHFLFTVDGLRQLLATFVTLLPVLAIGVIIGMATFYGFGSQCDCNFSQASVALAEYENLTARPHHQHGSVGLLPSLLVAAVQAQR